MAIEVFGINITPTIDAGHIVIAVSVLSAWIGSWKKRAQREATIPLRMTVLESQNLSIMKTLDLIQVRQLVIEDSVKDGAHQSRNARTVVNRMYDEIHNGNGKNDAPSHVE